MSTKINNFKKRIDNATHTAYHLPHGAYPVVSFWLDTSYQSVAAMTSTMHCGIGFRTTVLQRNEPKIYYRTYGHNRDISDTVFPYQSRATLLVNSASCLSACVYAQAGELKFH